MTQTRPIDYAPPQRREEATRLADLEKAISTSYLVQVADIIARLSYGDMMLLGAALAAIEGANTATPEGFAALLHKWAKSHVQQA